MKAKKDFNPVIHYGAKVLREKIPRLTADQVLADISGGDVSCPWCGKYTNLTFYGGIMQCWHCKTVADQPTIISKVLRVDIENAKRIFVEMGRMEDGRES